MANTTNKDRIIALEGEAKSHDRAIRGYNGQLGLQGRLTIVERQLATINRGVWVIFIIIVGEFLARIFGVI